MILAQDVLHLVLGVSHHPYIMHAEEVSWSKLRYDSIQTWRFLCSVTVSIHYLRNSTNIVRIFVGLHLCLRLATSPISSKLDADVVYLVHNYYNTTYALTMMYLGTYLASSPLL